MPFFTKKLVKIEAFQLPPAGQDSTEELIIFLNGMNPNWKLEEGNTITIKTLEGDHKASEGDYIIKGVKDEYYPCKPDIFRLTYDDFGSYKGMNFGDVIAALKKYQRASRENWNGKDMYIELQKTTPMSKMSLPYIYMSTVHGELVPWMASQTDMLAEDWRIVKGV